MPKPPIDPHIAGASCQLSIAIDMQTNAPGLSPSASSSSFCAFRSSIRAPVVAKREANEFMVVSLPATSGVREGKICRGAGERLAPHKNARRDRWGLRTRDDASVSKCGQTKSRTERGNLWRGSLDAVRGPTRPRISPGRGHHILIQNTSLRLSSFLSNSFLNLWNSVY